MTETISPGILNIAAYKFVRLQDLESLREELRELTHRLELHGTILLSSEGINLFLAGSEESVEELLAYLYAKRELEDLEVKRSYSDKVPFRRMLVRLKREIIPCGVDSVRPAESTSPKLSARELKRWLDEGRPVRLLDVRNKYEVELGTFRGAEHLQLGHFRDFTESLGTLPEEAKGQPVVMFCTGGIRCEKAGPLMEQAGFREVYQLDGGILKYFEQCGGDHYDGSCFVFDGRVALDPQLQPTGNLLCFNCQAVLTSDDVVSGRFMFGEYCPHCYLEPAEQKRREVGERQAKIRAIAESQPGSTPYDNSRKIHVPGRFAGWKLIDFLEAWQPAIERVAWLAWLGAGEITAHDTACHPDQIVREGECFIHHMRNIVEPPINPDIALIYEDRSLVVVNKPAPLPCHPSGRFNRNSLLSIMSPAFPNEKLRMAHRLDANTTGVVLFCRKYRAARLVQPQFSNRGVKKRYLARVHGHPSWQSLLCDLGIGEAAIDSGGLRSSAGTKEALSEFRVLKRFDDGTTLVEAIPITGRTHQLRIHLSAVGHGILGDPVYFSDKMQPQCENAELPSLSQPDRSGSRSGIVRGGHGSTSSVTEPPMRLHAWSLELTHPETCERTTFTAPVPSWAAYEGLW